MALLSLEQKRGLIERDIEQPNVSKQCQLLLLARSSLYYRSNNKRRKEGEEFDNLLMRLIDELYTEAPFYGVRRLARGLKEQDHIVSHKRIRRLMRQMGIEAIRPKCRRNLSAAAAEHRKYPYLLKEISIDRPNRVWCSDITYIPTRRGFAYLTAVMDWFSRRVLSWNLSPTMEAGFCVEALKKALEGGAKPDIFNTDQGVQFTGAAFTGLLQEQGIQISMDGRGRVFDNIFIERLWRSVKYEEVYIKDYQSLAQAKEGLDKYLNFYNCRRFHQSLNYQTPDAVYFSAQEYSRKERTEGLSMINF